jgi:hypothetical protein
MADRSFKQFQGNRGRLISEPGGMQPPAVALDRFGKVLEAGHLVLFHPGEDLVFEVVDVRPVLNPNAPAGRAMQVTLRAAFPVQTVAALPDRGMVIVGESQERLNKQASENGAGAIADEIERVEAEEGAAVPTTDPGLPADPSGKPKDEPGD